MNVFSRRMIRGFSALVFVCSSVTTARAQTATSRIVNAANNFLSTLDGKQRQRVLFSFDDEKQRANWSNLPVSFVPRGGISLKEMNTAQRSAAMALVSSALSTRGFEKVQQIMEGDEVNKATDTGRPPGPGGNNGGRTPGGNNGGGPPPGNPGNTFGNGSSRPPFDDGPIFGKDLYYISILG